MIEADKQNYADSSVDVINQHDENSTAAENIVNKTRQAPFYSINPFCVPIKYLNPKRSASFVVASAPPKPSTS
jgi:hypothetical protein